MTTEIETARVLPFTGHHVAARLTGAELDDFDARMLLILADDLEELDETVRRIRVVAHAMAKEHGIALPQ